MLSIPKRLPGISEIVSIVVDDGSSDSTFNSAIKFADYTLKHVVNLGQGAAMITGFKLAKRIGCSIAVTIDADGQHNPENIIRLIDPIIKNEPTSSMEVECLIVEACRLLKSLATGA